MKLSLFLIGLIWGGVYLRNVADYKRAVKETTFGEMKVKAERKTK